MSKMSRDTDILLQRNQEAETSRQSSRSDGAWFILQDVGTIQQRLCSNDFQNDAELLLTGDFKDANESFAFACKIAEQLNAPVSERRTIEALLALRKEVIHSRFNHDFEKDADRCRRCKIIAEADAVLSERSDS